MIRFNKEKIKSYLLFILILASIVQAGVLLVYQNRLFPFKFFSTTFGKNSIADNEDIEEKARQELLIPYRIVISNGNNVHWLLKENDRMFNMLWDEVQGYAKKILTEGGGQIVDSNAWERLVMSKSFIFEFREGIKSSLIRWVFNISSSPPPEQPESIHKVAILPDEDINKNNILYILTDENLYKYVLPFNKHSMEKGSYEKIISMLESDQELIRYNVIKEIDPNKQWPFEIPSDILCVVTGPKYKKYAAITYSFGGQTGSIEEKAEIILGNEKESYDRYIMDKDDTLVFKNLKNTYRLYKNGMLEYRYTPGAGEQDKGDIGSAFKKAYTFINRIKNYLLDSDASLRLVEIREENPSYYEFILDYMVDGNPVHIDFKPEAEGEDNDNLKNAVKIRVDSRRIVQCEWLLINVKKDKGDKEYNIYFQYMLDEITKKYGKQTFNDFAIKNIMVAYLIDPGYEKRTEPVWIVDKPDSSYYYVPMIPKKDD